MMTRRMQRMMQQKQGAQQEGAPRQAMLMGEPHMLAYINEAERQMLKRAGGAEAPGPEGIPVYGWWADTFGGGNSFAQSVANAFTPNDGTTYVGGKLVNDQKPTSQGRNLDADNFAGSTYAPTSNAGTSTAYQTTQNNQGQTVAVDADTTEFNSPTSVTAGDLAAGNVDTYKNNKGGSITVKKGANPNDIPMVDALGDGVDNGLVYDGIDVGGGTGTGTGTSTGGNDGGGTSVVTAPPVNQALLDAQARRAAALAKQMGAVATAFGFSTDDYYNQLGTDYREGGLSEAFTTAYDDAVRGIYDVYKSAGMLTQSDVDDDLGILAGANSGEEGRMDSIVDQYMAANRNYVTEGRGGIEGELQGFVTDTEDIPTIDAQTAQILAYDVPGKSQPYKTPQEAEVVEFFSDFVKRAYDPSYNVDPTALASGGPKKVSGSVDQLGAGTQPSTIAGILDPVKGGSVKVVG